jgi:hypothetical protein
LTGLLASFITSLQTTVSFLIWFSNSADRLESQFVQRRLEVGSATISAVCFCNSAMNSGGSSAGDFSFCKIY